MSHANNDELFYSTKLVKFATITNQRLNLIRTSKKTRNGNTNKGELLNYFILQKLLKSPTDQ